MMPTKRFKQERGRIYHNCDTDRPCKLFPRFIGEEPMVKSGRFRDFTQVL